MLQADEAAASIIAPKLGETYALPASAPAPRLKTGDPELQSAVGRDWQNDYADFSIHLKKQLQDIESASARREALARMSEVLRSYQSHRDKRKAKSG
jgi:metallo-beta-lactamase family protein